MKYCETLCCAGVIQEKEETELLCATCKWGKLNVVLDLDETLVHSVHKSITFQNCDAFAQFEDYKIYKRPHVDEFLNIVFKRYNVYIWTAACKSYAKVVCEKLLGQHVPIKMLSKKQTLKIKIRNGFYYSSQETITVKPLSTLKCNMNRTIMIDDTKSCFSRNIKNGFQIIPFDDPEKQINDCQLLEIVSLLQILEDMQDITKCLHIIHL